MDRENVERSDMVRSAADISRAADLARLVPEFLRETPEFQTIFACEEAELLRLYERMDELWADGFIETATARGIGKFEGMLGIRPYPGDSLSDRRAAVLMKWNQQLPYTLPRLRERLNGLVGEGQYRLEVRAEACELELVVFEQTYRVLQSLLELTRAMIPANLLFLFAGKYAAVFFVPGKAANCLGVRSEFYARYNREFLFLDGSFLLDGSYVLSGYRELEALSECSSRLTVQQSQRVKIGAEARLRVEQNLWYLDGSRVLDGSMVLNAGIFEEVLSDGRERMSEDVQVRAYK